MKAELKSSEFELNSALDQQADLLEKKSQLEKQIQDYKSDLFRLKSELEKAQDFSKEYREMNNKLSHEIIRLKRRLAGHLPLELRN